jgi:hypothetical protein
VNRSPLRAVALVAALILVGYALFRTVGPGAPGAVVPTPPTPAADIAQATQAAALAPTSVPAEPTPAGAADPSAEVAPRPIDLAGPAADRLAEMSSLTRFGPDFVLLPQFPGRYHDLAAGVDEEATTETAGHLFALAESDVLAALDGGESSPLEPRAIPFTATAAVVGIPGFEGFEAIAFLEDQVFLTVESQTDEDGTKGWIVAGTFELDGDGRVSAIRLDERAPVAVPLPRDLDNMSLESLLVTEGGLLTFFEANGANVNPEPMDQRIGFDLALKDQVPFPVVEYRITDATEADAEGCFWAINYMFPGDAATLQPAEDAIAARWGEGPTHAQYDQVERLLELCYADGRLNLADRAPIQLQLVDAETSRNWEGIERLGERGFLLVTDKFPATILSFVPRAAP